MSVLSLLPEDKKKENRKESLESVYSSNSRLSLLNKRKRLNPLMVDMSQPKGGDRYVAQRVLSAKTHKVKQLQNQLADAHYHLQELSNENRVLRALQKKQEIALQRYENSNSELPHILSSHSEELRIQQTKFKQLKQQYKEASQKLKERDIQLQQLRDEHNHLLELSKDRNLLEREKLQSQVSELTLRTQQQSDTISTLQRRIALEAKNFRHQLQNEINKHKDTRQDLDLAISNADKLSTIIEMKEKMISTASYRTVKSPTKAVSTGNIPRPLSKGKPQDTFTRSADARNHIDQDVLSRLCESSRNISSAMSQSEDRSSSIERSRFSRNRTSSNSTKSITPNQTRKNSKSSEEGDLSRAVEDGMAQLAIYDDQLDFNKATPDEVQLKMETMKAELLDKIKNEKEDDNRYEKLLSKKSPEESIEEDINEHKYEQDIERPKSRGRRNSSVSFFSEVEENAVVSYHGVEVEVAKKTKRESSATERKMSGKQIDKYCKNIIDDIEKSSKVIDKHMKQLNHSKFESDKLVQQLQAVDKINDFVSFKGDIPESALTELNNNFKMLTEQTFSELPVARKRTISGRRGARGDERNSVLGDDNLSNQDLLEDLLGRK